ncbi:MAG TPA: isopentenyl-diphosphate Delta-isomerase [Acidimicrobiales bacterium]|nr:isopentenyl-diphosphate Delta-isomerase [Acidimicrobiales bacterium]
MTDVRTPTSPDLAGVPAPPRPIGIGPATEADADQVVLLDDLGRPAGRRPRRTVHDRQTPLHLGFSCYVVDRDGRVLVTRRALTKRTWPGVWTNACCGHPRPGEALGAAVARRLRDELGVRAQRMALGLPDFAYRASMDDGCVEHELCPVVVALVDDVPRPDPAEVAEVAWIAWEDLVARARERPASLSPWAVLQIRELHRRVASPVALLAEAAAGPSAGAAPGDLLGPGPAFAASGPSPSSPSRGSAGGDDPVAPVRPAVEAVIDDFLTRQECELGQLDPAVGDLTAEIRRLVAAGGKRLRPAFVLWGHAAAGGDRRGGAVVAAAALELLHTFALLHDDVMDRSRRRRGLPAAHVALARRHRADRLTGDGEWFGASAAVLAGDLCSVWADQLFGATPLPPVAVAAGRQVFDRLRAEVICGQYLDLRQAHDPATDEDTATRVALLKSARYTVTRPLQLGAALAGGDGAGSLAAALATYGDAVGLAFQMRDDVLGMFGDPTSTGKNGVDDLREGKRTLLVLRALRLTADRDRDRLRRALGDPDLDPAGAARCRAIVAASGARASIEALIAAEQARAVAAVAGLADPARTALVRLAALASDRDR